MQSVILNQSTPTTFGEVRQLILETIVNIREGGLSIQQGLAIAANFKELNNNILAEIAAAKLSLATEDQAHSFGKVMRLGSRVVNGVEE